MESPLKAWIRALERTAPIEQEPRHIFVEVIDSLAQRFGDALAVSSPTRALTYAQLAAMSNRIARWGIAQELASGDVVCLLMPNRPEYLAVWIGLSRIGVTVALLNAQLSGSALAHCIRIAGPRLIITDERLQETLLSASAQLPAGVGFHTFGTDPENCSSLEHEFARFDAAPVTSVERIPPAQNSNALFIYTSGTTGLPKAAKVSHQRIMQWTHWFSGMMNVCPSDRMYNCLPLYHSVGGIVAAGATLVGGGCVIIRERFSASKFWEDVVAEGCTLFQYIGELCRFLLAAPEHPLEARHKLRLACGNGLRAEVWKPFQDRFAIPQILEYYASTEGNFSLYNCEGRIGSIGRIPPFLAHRLPVALVRFDLESEMPMRDQAGRCIRCSRNEVGEALGLMESEEERSTGRFEGYADVDATERKILRDVFVAGDSWYRTGDLMSQDKDGFYYFSDRIGDTFRWKGENISASEVSAVIAACDGVVNAATYGVRIPGADGRAGMSAVAVNDQFELRMLWAHLVAHLPEFARPVFLRIVSEIELTGTLKLSKHRLATQAYNPALCDEPLYYADRGAKAFVPLTEDFLARLAKGLVRF